MRVRILICQGRGSRPAEAGKTSYRQGCPARTDHRRWWSQRVHDEGGGSRIAARWQRRREKPRKFVPGNVRRNLQRVTEAGEVWRNDYRCSGG